MTAEHLLQEAKNQGEIKVDESIIYSMREFQVLKDITSITSLVLTISGHQPIKTHQFSMIKFESWCKENELLFFTDPINRTVILSSDKHASKLKGGDEIENNINSLIHDHRRFRYHKPSVILMHPISLRLLMRSTGAKISGSSSSSYFKPSYSGIEIITSEDLKEGEVRVY